MSFLKITNQTADISYQLKTANELLQSVLLSNISKKNHLKISQSINLILSSQNKVDEINLETGNIVTESLSGKK